MEARRRELLGGGGDDHDEMRSDDESDIENTDDLIPGNSCMCFFVRSLVSVRLFDHRLSKYLCFYSR